MVANRPPGARNNSARSAYFRGAGRVASLRWMTPDEKGDATLAPLLLDLHIVVKAFVLSTVLALSLGPHAARLCLAWCQPVVAEADCHDDAPVSASAMVSQADCCEPGATSPAVFTTVLRDHATPHGAAALCTPSVPFRLDTGARYSRATDVSPPRPGRLRATVLRI
jgi:hypothetical protein